MATQFYQPDEKQRLIEKIKSQHRILVETRQTHKQYKRVHESRFLTLIKQSRRPAAFKKRFDALTHQQHLSSIQKLVDLQHQKLIAQVEYESTLLSFKAKQTQNKQSRENLQNSRRYP